MRKRLCQPHHGAGTDVPMLPPVRSRSGISIHIHHPAEMQTLTHPRPFGSPASSREAGHSIQRRTSSDSPGMSSPNSAAWQKMRKETVAALKSHPTFPCFCSFTSATSSGFKGCHCHGANPSGQAFICIHTRTHTHARPHKARLSSGTGSIQSLFPILVATIPTPTARSWVEREKKPELY